MEQKRFRHVSVKADAYDKLEEVRKSTGSRSIAEVVEILAERAFKEQKKLALEIKVDR